MQQGADSIFQRSFQRWSLAVRASWVSIIMFRCLFGIWLIVSMAISGIARFGASIDLAPKAEHRLTKLLCSAAPQEHPLRITRGYDLCRSALADGKGQFSVAVSACGDHAASLSMSASSARAGTFNRWRNLHALNVRLQV
jgi:hypothetical protein